MKIRYIIPRKKYCLTAALALCLMLLCLPSADARNYPWPDSGTCGPNAGYEIVDGVMTISGTGPVTYPLDFFDCPIHTVIIEDGITALERPGTLSPSTSYPGGNMAIRKVTIPGSVRFIGAGSFANTPWLDSQTEEFLIVGDGILLDYNGEGGEVTIPDSVRSIAGKSFYQNGNVTSVAIGSNVEEIGDSAFYGCTALERAIIDAPVIGAYAFWACGKLNDVAIADTVSSIGSSAFDDTPWLEGQTDEFFIVGDGILLDYNGPGVVVVVPETVRMIPTRTFGLPSADDMSRRVTEITIPATVTEIEPVAIEGGGFDAVAPPVVVHGEPGSAAEKFALSGNSMCSYRFVPFGQEDGSLYNFLDYGSFSEYTFSDVSKDDWFYDNVASAYSIGLMKGKTFNDFVPTGDIKLSEAITVAARVRDTYYYEQTDFTAAEGAVWYQPYLDYALANKILQESPTDLNRPATRAEFASLLAAALPEREYEAIHNDIHFEDMDETHPAYDAIMLLAGAGVMQGKGEGLFDADAQVKRCEAAAMLARCVQIEQRVQPDLT